MSESLVQNVKDQLLTSSKPLRRLLQEPGNPHVKELPEGETAPILSVHSPRVAYQNLPLRTVVTVC